MATSSATTWPRSRNAQRRYAAGPELAGTRRSLRTSRPTPSTRTSSSPRCGGARSATIDSSPGTSSQRLRGCTPARFRTSTTRTSVSSTIRSAPTATAARCMATFHLPRAIQSRRASRFRQHAARTLGDVINLSNTKTHDYAYSYTGELQKRFSNAFEGQIAYTYGRSYDVWDLTSSVAFSNWSFGRSYSGRQDAQDLYPSKFDVPHRVIAGGTYTFPDEDRLVLQLRRRVGRAVRVRLR